MGHSMEGGGTYYLGATYKDIWAALAPISGLGCIADAAAAEPFTSMPMLLLHGEKDSITSSTSAAAPSRWKRFSCSLPPFRNGPT
jgi:poly(3-hydroxybutyrate) depolymerase